MMTSTPLSNTSDGVEEGQMWNLIVFTAGRKMSLIICVITKFWASVTSFDLRNLFLSLMLSLKYVHVLNGPSKIPYIFPIAVKKRKGRR